MSNSERIIPAKFQAAELPQNQTQALEMAEEREAWAKQARENDKHGSAKEWELTAKLLRFFASGFTSK